MSLDSSGKGASRRRALAALAAGGLALALPRPARSAAAMKRVGVIGRPGGLVLTEWKDRFPAEFRANGFTEGRDLELVWYSVGADEDPPPTAAQMLALARRTVGDMVAGRLDCMVARQEVDTRMLLEATGTTPIVTADVPDPVGAGFAKSLAHPGGNVTGLHTGLTDIALKSIELHRALQPGLGGFAWIGWSNFRAQALPFEAAARSVGLRYASVLLDGSEGDPSSSFMERFAQLRREGIQAAHLLAPDTAIYKAAAAASFQHRIALSGGHASGTPGILFSYNGAPLGAQQEPVRRVPAIVARILRGEKPGDIPFEGPARYELVLSMPTAAKLRIELPRDVVVRADRVVR